MKENVIKNNTAVVTPDGEILEHIQDLTIPVGEEPPYYKVYLQDLSNVMGLNPTERSVFEALCANMSFTNIVVLIKPIKEMLCEMAGRKYDTIKAAISSLTAKGMLIRKDRAVYLVNPKYAARGHWADIKALRLTIEYNDSGRHVEVTKVSSKAIELREGAVIQQELPFSDTDAFGEAEQ